MSMIMVDIETLGTAKDAVILSIGAVQFNEQGVEKKFYAQIDPESCTNFGLKIDARTVMWWLDQSDAARKALTSTKGMPLDLALNDLYDAFDWKDKQVWANGIDFDFVILENAFNAVGIKAPWMYWSKMDYRTVKNLVPRKVFEAYRKDAGVSHNALADAIAQAATLVELLKWVNHESD